ncbi:hypothetical protein FJT64_019136 [Amphibalanus amphitrite]|uniref:Gustatory receptor n=1 Tax=Amphibalanus amphitrite TaxID=1232801 RepID=A0A6A4X5W6_AMPAM|nr:hypothetical protein FJT64_019136 [Amphibalanus amphitrite]
MRIRFLRVEPSQRGSPAGRPAPGDTKRADEEDLELPSGACRSFVRLLSTVGLSAGRGWTPVVGALLAFVVHSSIGFFYIYLGFRSFQEDQHAGKPFFTSLFHSNFMGIPQALMYVSVVLSLAVGRRRYSRVMFDLSGVLKELELLPQPATSWLRPNSIGTAMWALTAGLAVSFFATKIHPTLGMCGVTTPPVDAYKESCAGWLALTFGLAFFNISSVAFVAMKFILAGLLLAHGLQLVNGRLEALATAAAATDTATTTDSAAAAAEAGVTSVVATEAGVASADVAEPPLSDEAELRRLGRLHRRLSEVTSSLCSAMSPELTMLIAVGVLSQVMLAALLFSTVQDMGWLLRYLPLAAVSMGGPCETCQQLLNRLDAGRRQLLRLEWHRPQLGGTVGPLLRNIQLDLETVGDLGLFRLRRSTLLSVWSTIATYIIVMAQFKMSETP